MQFLEQPEWLQDAEVMEQIDRDVMRTHPGLHFFSGDDGTAVTHREVRAPALTCMLKPRQTSVSVLMPPHHGLHQSKEVQHIPSFWII